MIEIYAAVVFLFVLPYLAGHPFSMPRDTLLALAPAIVIANYQYIPVTIPVAAGLGMVTVGLISSFFARRPDLSAKYILLLLGAVLIGAASREIALKFILVCAVVYAAIGLHQEFTGRIDTIDRLAPDPGGLTGNVNVAGMFLAPAVFVAIHTGDWLVGIFIVFALVATRCRGALFGLLFAAMAIHPVSWLTAGAMALAPVIAMLMRGRPGKYTWASIESRFTAWRRCRRYLTAKVMVVGQGPDNSRCYLPDSDFDQWYTHAHNDVLQAALDAGIIQVALYLVAFLSAIWFWSSAGDVWLAGAVITVMVGGLVFHSQHYSITLLLSWILICQAPAPTLFIIEIPPNVQTAGLITLTAAWAATWLRALMADICLRQFQRTSLIKYLFRANSLTPRSSLVKLLMAIRCYHKRKYDLGYSHAVDAIVYFDGDSHLATSYFYAGICAWHVGWVHLAVPCVRNACRLDPTNTDFSHRLADMHKKLQKRRLTTDATTEC